MQLYYVSVCILIDRIIMIITYIYINYAVIFNIDYIIMIILFAVQLLISARQTWFCCVVGRLRPTQSSATFATTWSLETLFAFLQCLTSRVSVTGSLLWRSGLK